MTNIVISGSSGAIAKALIKELLKNPENKIYGLDIIEPEIKSENFFHIKTNLTNSQEIQHSISLLPPKIDKLFHLAGIMRRGTYLNCTEQDYDLVMDINLKSCFMLQKMIHEKLADNCAILFMSSRHGLNPKTDPFAYSLSKFGLWELSESAKLLNPKWKVKTAFPGSVDTALSWLGVEEKDKEAKAKRMISSEKIATHLLKLLDSPEQYLNFDEQTLEYSLSDKVSPCFMV